MADQSIDLFPVRPDAAAVSIHPAPDWITLSPGATGGNMEILVDMSGEWESELRFCLASLVEGRYHETFVKSSLGKGLTRTFEAAAEEPIVYTHYSAFDEFEVGTRRFAPYR